MEMARAPGVLAATLLATPAKSPVATPVKSPVAILVVAPMESPVESPKVAPEESPEESPVTSQVGTPGMVLARRGSRAFPPFPTTNRRAFQTMNHKAFRTSLFRTMTPMKHWDFQTPTSSPTLTLTDLRLEIKPYTPMGLGKTKTCPLTVQSKSIIESTVLDLQVRGVSIRKSS